MNDLPAAPDEQAAQRLETPEQLSAVYAAVVASALDAVIVVDERGVVVAINPAAIETFGYSREAAVGRRISDLIVPDHMKDAHEAGIARYRATREPHVLGRRVEMEARCRDGRIIPVELAITEVVLPEGRYFTANLRDLSSARAAVAEIERQREALHQSEKLAAIGSLLAGVAHELNNPLSIVLGQSTLLREEAATGFLRRSSIERTEKIEAAAQRCVRVVRAFLAIARQRKAETRAVQARPIVSGAIELLRYGIESSGIVVRCDIPAGLPDVVADPDQVQNILTNLLVNATHALEAVEGPREIRVSAIERDGRLSIVVADSGAGIPREIAQRVFDPFFTTKPQGVGTGIGLSISRGLAEAQGGTLSLLETDIGAAFELSLPTTGRRTVPGHEDAAKAASAAVGEDRPRAIVIDDEPEIALLLADAMEKAGYRCDMASGGSEGKAMIAADPLGYDAIVCDLRMPDLDGPALFRWLKAHHPALAERVLFVTGDALGPVSGRFLAESGRPVLEKPFTPAEVADVVEAFPRRA
ncbi:MAG: PAS domain S-box protein [Rhizobiaceae bacterium]|nr:MAG: PAS domain S-box protein [Rhizobiaceae bacterium]CAG0984943.1 two-component system, LuxR family, sensor kinase FixL [Rhizobiaceae bacterium]